MFSSRIAIINPKGGAPYLCDLVLDKARFFYSDQTVYCVHYPSKKIFFLFNAVAENSGNNIYEHFVTDFDPEKNCTLYLTPIAYNYLTASRCLIDFSLCYSDTHIFLIWGREKTTLEPNNGIFSYEISLRKWSFITLQSFRPDNTIARLNAASICFKVKSQNSIYILGGYPVITKTSHDIYDMVDLVSFSDGQEKATICQFNKKSYVNNYKPLLDGQLIHFESPSFSKTPAEFKAILIGGTFSKFIFNQEKSPVTINLVSFGINPSDESAKVIFENFPKYLETLKALGEGVSLIFASKSKNFCLLSDSKTVGIVSCLFSHEKKGIFLEYFADPNSHPIEQRTFHTLCDDSYQKLTRLQICSEKQEKINQKMKYIYSTLSLNAPLSLRFVIKKQLKPLFEVKKIDHLKKFFEPDMIYNSILIDEENPAEIILITSKQSQKNELVAKDDGLFSIGFYANDLKKENYLYYEYLPTRLKFTNYTLKGSMLYILVNNEKDTNFHRIIYSVNTRTIDKDSRTRIELFRVFENERNRKGCSIVADSKCLYVVGGESSDARKTMDIEHLGIEEEKYNFSYDLQRSMFGEYFANNLIEMVSPYVIHSNDHLYCINRKIITNPYLELDFKAKEYPDLEATLEELSSSNGNYLYGELIKTTQIKSEVWRFFLLDLVEAKFMIFPGLNFGQKTQRSSPGPHVSLDLLFVGKVSNPEGLLFLYSYIDETRQKKKKSIFINFEELLSALCQGLNINPVKEKDITPEHPSFHEKDFLLRIRDYSQLKEKENEETFVFSQTKQKISFDKDLEILRGTMTD